MSSCTEGEGRFAARPLRVGKAAAVGSSEDDPSQERPQEVPSEAGEEGGEQIPFRADKGVTVVRRWRCISLHKGQSRFYMRVMSVLLRRVRSR